jgi:hypothetical protein
MLVYNSTNVAVNGNTIEQKQKHGIEFNGGTEVAIAGNAIKGMLGHGIEITPSGTQGIDKVVISDNKIYNAYHGIDVRSVAWAPAYNVNLVTITGNLTSTTCRGLDVAQESGAGVVWRVNIVGNTFNTGGRSPRPLSGDCSNASYDQSILVGSEAPPNPPNPRFILTVGNLLFPYPPVINAALTYHLEADNFGY